jgi:hypothetical protein
MEELKPIKEFLRETLEKCKRNSLPAMVGEPEGSFLTG